MRACHRVEAHASAEEQLVLLLASTGERRTADHSALLTLTRTVDVERVAATLNRHRLARLGIMRLRDAAVEDLARELEELLGERLRQRQMRSAVQEIFSDAMLALLDEHGLPAVPLKGVTLSRRLYGDGAIREANDVDLLLLPEHLERAVALTRERFGFDAPRDVVDRDGLPRLHHRLEHRRGAPPVELHWRVHWYETRSGPAMLRRSIRDGGHRGLAPADEFASLLLFYARDGFVGIGPLATIASWWDRYGVELEPGALPALAAEFPELMPSLAPAGDLAARLVGIPVPDWRWQPSERVRARQARARRMVNWRAIGSYEKISAEAALVDVLLAPPGSGWQSVRRRASILGEQDARLAPGERPPGWRIGMGRLWHAAAMIVRVSVAFLTSSISRPPDGRSAVL